MDLTEVINIQVIKQVGSFDYLGEPNGKKKKNI